VTAESGIRHLHRRGVFDQSLANIMPWISSIGAAAAVSDYDLDGDLDLYLTSSCQGFPNALYRNDGDLRFTETAALAGVAALNDREGVSMDAAFADLDQDGDDDLYVVLWGRNRLFRNEGNGTFTDVTEASGTGDRGNGNCVLPFDYDNDGLLDLLVCNYFPDVDLQKLEHTRIMHDSFEAARNGGADVLYRNLGGMRFEETAHRLQLDDRGWSLDAAISDIDNDGDLDLYIANDFGQDKVFLANGDGTFTDVTEKAIGRETFKGMNIDFGDFNNDGFTDGYVANITTQEYLREGNMLLLNAGDGTFSNVADATGTFDGGWGWCARFFDYDHDGFLDLVAVNGFVTADGPETYWEALATKAVEPDFRPEDSREWPSMGNQSLSGNEPALLFRNRGDGSFEEVAAKYGLRSTYDGRGIALADFDQDGDLDVYFANQSAPGNLFRNDVGSAHRFLLLTLVGTRSNRNGIGARVQATIAGAGAGRGGEGPMRLTREVNGVNGYASQSSYTVHFGLGEADRVERLTVFWPSGVVQDFEDVPADKHYRLVEAGEPLAAAKRQELYFARARAAHTAESVAAAPSQSVLDLEETLRRKPRNIEIANQYRRLSVDGGHFDRSIEFFRRLAKEHEEHAAVRLSLALAYIDKIPFIKDVLTQASLAKESLGQLAWVEERHPDLYAVHYLRGMNHLYWPAAMKELNEMYHRDIAIQHFERCRALEEGRAASEGRALARYHAEVFRALGDAHVKAERFAEARAVWREGLDLYPGHEDLKARLDLVDLALKERIKDERGLAQRIDTSLSFLVETSGLEASERAILEAPGERSLLGAYRREAFELDALPRALAFLERVARESAGSGKETPELTLHIALAAADQISAVGRATPETLKLAERVLAELEAYRALAPADWLGPYLEGVCHLFRPLTEESAREAAAAFEEAVALARREDGTPRVPYPSVALGDALVLAGKTADAVGLWKRTAERFPRSRPLRARLECAAESLRPFVRGEYRLERGIPTDLGALADRDSLLREMEERIATLDDPEKRRQVSAEYRREAARSDDPERAITFFRGLLAGSPRSADLRVEMALALMDRTPDPELGSVRKGLLSSEALELLEEVRRSYPESWGVQYAIGLIHLNWFTKLKHVPSAVAAFERCIAMQAGKEAGHPGGALAYQALGDALVKQRDFPRGRRYWKDGVKLFPGDPGLEKRLGLTSLMVNRFVEETRSWATAEDTSLLSSVIGVLGDLPPAAAGG
jgi:tetratricopeptide (TPR) repeat protein